VRHSGAGQGLYNFCRSPDWRAPRAGLRQHHNVRERGLMYVLAGFASQRTSNVHQRVLVLDEDGPTRDAVCNLLSEAGYPADGCASWEAATEVLSKGEHTVLVKDQRHGGPDSSTYARELTRAHPAVSFILLDADGSSGRSVAALQAGVFDFMTKSFEPDALGEHLLDAVRRTFAEVEHETVFSGTLALSKDPVAEVLVGECSAIVVARERVRAALVDDAPVLITGEAGTEKLALARLLHEQGAPPGPFVVVGPARSDSGQAPEKADDAGGCFYFPDVGALDPAWQLELAKRLSLVETDAPRARIVAGLGQPTPSSWQGSMLARMFDNAGSHRISLPPLRERGRDIVIVAEHFAEQGRLALGDASLRIAPAALEALARYGWPGNVDELRFTIQHAASLCSASVIQAEDLPPSVGFSLEGPTDEGGTRLQVQSLEDMELSYILRVLDAVGGNKASAARLLGVDRTTLYRKLQRQEQAAAPSSETLPSSPSSRRVPR
jgi:two-component system response regulator AtoC